MWGSDAALALLVTFLAIFAPYAKTIGLAEAIQAAADLIDGKVRGRVVVDVNR